MPAPACSIVTVRARRGAPRWGNDLLLDRVATRLADRLAAVRRSFAVAADLGTPTEAVRRALAGRNDIGTMIAVDAVPDRLREHAGASVAADEEALPFRDASLDLVVSALALQFVNDLPGTLAQVRRALSPTACFSPP